MNRRPVRYQLALVTGGIVGFFGSFCVEIGVARDAASPERWVDTIERGVKSNTTKLESMPQIRVLCYAAAFLYWLKNYP